MEKILFIVMSIMLLLSGCRNNTKMSLSDEELEEDTILCCCPQATIYLQPYEDFSEQEVEKLLPTLEKHFNELMYGFWSFEVKKPVKFPADSKEGGKYRAGKLLKYEQTLLKGREVIIGLTHKDICAYVHNVKNYGIVGQSFLRRNVCVVSDKRLRNKSDFWKPIVHEFIHTFYGSKHCPNNDPRCIMNDAKGHGNFAIQKYLCDSCNKQ